jgi:2-polyprenyl-3-methyl-5-hydroxy-6-metoxy-1,4-benzoquinol methylase
VLRRDLFASPPATILDVGCGHGRAVEAIAKEGWHVVAFDAEVSWVREAVGRAPEAAGCVGDARHMPFHDGSVPGAVAMEIIEHFHQPRELIDEMRRVVQPGGAVMVTVPNGALERVYRRLNPAYWGTTTHQQTFSKRRLASLLRASGFDVVRVQSASFEWTLRWLVHSFLRSRFSATGELHNHLGVANAMDRMFGLLRRSTLARRALAAAGKLVGKTHVAECCRP